MSNVSVRASLARQAPKLQREERGRDKAHIERKSRHGDAKIWWGDRHHSKRGCLVRIVVMKRNHPTTRAWL